MTDTANDNQRDLARGGEESAGATATCPACGAAARRGNAGYCATCGRSLARDEYIPSDALRSSYHCQQRQLPLSRDDQSYISTTYHHDAPHYRRTHTPDALGKMNRHDEPRRRNFVNRHDPRGGNTHDGHRTRRRAEGSFMGFINNSNSAAATALALVTYALVPYLGILFCPGAVVLGGVGLLRARRAPRLGGQRASILSIVFGLVVLCAQIFLWWILYKVPQWAGQNF